MRHRRLAYLPSLAIACIGGYPQLVKFQDYTGGAPHCRECRARVWHFHLGEGYFVAGGLIYTVRSYRLSHRGQMTDRFTKALERLGSERLYVHIGAYMR
jgi:hypothetical protein